MAPHLNLGRRYEDCDVGYQWYTCQSGGQSYAGCCSVDPCGLSGFCPVDDDGGSAPVRTTQTRKNVPTRTVDPNSANTGEGAGMTTVYVTTPPTVTAATSPNAALEPATATSTVSVSPTALAESDSGSSIPVGAAVGVAVGAVVVAALAALCIWGRWRRRNNAEARKSEKGSLRSSSGSAKLSPGKKAKGARSPRVLIPPSSPSRSLNAYRGYYRDDDSPSQKDNGGHHFTRVSQFSAGDRSTLVSPVTPCSISMDTPLRQELDSKQLQPELDSTPVTSVRSSTLAEVDGPTAVVYDPIPGRGLPPNSVWDRGGYGTPPLTQRPIDRPRATLKATAYERLSQTYANSWTKFQNVQV